MPTLTLAIPKELKHEMGSIPELNWSEIARGAILKKIKEYKLFKSIISKSKFSEEDADILSDKVKSSMLKGLKKRELV